MDRPRLFLIDAFGFIFRAYHARARSGAPPMNAEARELEERIAENVVALLETPRCGCA